MEEQTSIQSLALNNAISDDTAWQCKHYTGRGVRKLHESGTALVEDVEAPVSKMPDSSKAQYQAPLKTARDPNGGPYPAFSSGKSWNETSDKTGSEKKFYHNVSSGADFAEGVQVSENLGIALASQLAQAETAEAVKIGTRLPAGPGRPVLENPPVTTRTVAHRQVPLIQRVQKIVEVPRVQFIDRVVDDPAAMQRQASTIKKRRKAEGQDQDVDVERFKDLVLPSSQSCLCVSIASSDEGGDEADGEEEELKQQAEATSLVQGREHRREEDETDTQVPGGELVQVAPNMGAGGSHPQATMDQEWDKELREIRRMIEFLGTGNENSTSRRTWQPEGWRGWKERAPSSKTRSAKPASEEPSRTAPKS